MNAQTQRGPPIEDEDRNPAVHARDSPEQVVELSLTELYPFKNHPFHVVDDVHIAGVQFDVFQGDTLVGTMTTNAQGIAIIEDLEKGTYTVKEHALPTGYVGELTEMTAVVVSDQITELPATNTPQPQQGADRQDRCTERCCAARC